MEEEGKVDFNILPEGCISYTLSLTSPRDACRSSLVSLLFKSASDSDVVWEKFLPLDYEEIISRSISTSTLAFSSKKELYFHLCDHPILIDGGNKSFRLEKQSGKKCYMLGARDLSIIWENAPQYWMWRALPQSRFAEVAELLDVLWIEIQGKIETRLLSPNTNYGVYLVIKFIEGAYGIHNSPAKVLVEFVGHKCQGDQVGSGRRHNIVYLSPYRRRRQIRIDHIGSIRSRFGSIPRGQFPMKRRDGWMEIKMGEFFNDKGDGELQMTLTDMKGVQWKFGLIVEGIEIRPKEST